MLRIHFVAASVGSVSTSKGMGHSQHVRVPVCVCVCVNILCGNKLRSASDMADNRSQKGNTVTSQSVSVMSSYRVATCEVCNSSIWN